MPTFCFTIRSLFLKSHAVCLPILELSGQFQNRNVGMIRSAMKVKLEDAEYDERQTRNLFNMKLKEYKNNSISVK